MFDDTENFFSISNCVSVTFSWCVHPHDIPLSPKSYMVIYDIHYIYIYIYIYRYSLIFPYSISIFLAWSTFSPQEISDLCCLAGDFPVRWRSKMRQASVWWCIALVCHTSGLFGTVTFAQSVSHRIHGAAIYGNIDPINIPHMLAYIPYMDPMGIYIYNSICI